MHLPTKRILPGLLALALFLIPVAAIAATSLFEDVSDDNIFVSDINWLKTTGISRGCNPPANTKYCPEESVTREQMAALLRRLATSRVVDAATASSATRADSATTAGDSDKVDGKHAADLASVTASTSVDLVAFSPTVSNPLAVASISGFIAPTGGGVLTVSANMVDTRMPGDPGQFGLIWIEIDKGGSCGDTPVSNPGGVGWYNTVSDIASSTSTLATTAVSAGSHRIDLCTAGVTNAVTIVDAHMSVTWTPTASGAGVLGNVAARTYQDLLAPARAAYGG